MNVPREHLPLVPASTAPLSDLVSFLDVAQAQIALSHRRIGKVPALTDFSRSHMEEAVVLLENEVFTRYADSVSKGFADL